MASPLTVYTVTLELQRSDGSRTHDRKWVAAETASQARELALESAARRWPGYTLVGVVSVRVDHSRRARRFLRQTGDATSELRVPPTPSVSAEFGPVGDAEEVGPSGGRSAWRLLDEAARALRLRQRQDATSRPDAERTPAAGGSRDDSKSG